MILKKILASLRKYLNINGGEKLSESLWNFFALKIKETNTEC